jgi:hypothetical protein
LTLTPAGWQLLKTWDGGNQAKAQVLDGRVILRGASTHRTFDHPPAGKVLVDADPTAVVAGSQPKPQLMGA